MQLQIEKSAAVKAHQEATPEGKKLLQNLFGEKTFDQKITDRVKTWEDACAIAGETPHKCLPYDDTLPFDDLTEEQKAINAIAKLSLIRSVLNEGWEPDWTNSNERKWAPWFDMSHPAGVGLDCVGGYFSRSSCGSRLVFKTEELARYAATQFLPLYKDLFTL